MPAQQRSTKWIVSLAVFAVCGWFLAAYVAVRWREGGASRPPRPEATELSALLPQVEAAFRQIARDPVLAGAAIAFCVLDERGEPLFASPLAETVLCPASTLKIVTTGAALEILGPEFAFETALCATASINEAGLVDGDLVLVGGGDPTLAYDDLSQLIRAAVAGGLKAVAGRVRVDASVFPANPVNDHWVWGDVGNGYGAGAFGLNLEHNRVPVRFEPEDEEGSPASVTAHGPVPADLVWRNFVTTGPAGSGDQVVAYSEPFGRRITLRGTAPRGESGFTISAANPDPIASATEFIKQQLAQSGVRFGSRLGPYPEGARVTLASHRSEALPAIIDHLHRVSDNLEAQCLFLTIGRIKKSEPAAAIRKYWESVGVQFEGLRLLDGSGLARANMIRPLDLARVAHAAGRAPNGDHFRQSLSTYLDGAVRAKLGAMSGVNTQVGFVRTDSGRELAFAFMANGLPPDAGAWGAARQLLEQVRNTVPAGK